MEAEKVMLEGGRAKARPSVRVAGAAKPPRLSYREQREWDEMEARILEAEQRLEDCQRAASEPGVAADHAALTARVAALAAAHAEVDALYARWAELEAKVTV
jgi:ATP-binding cassette subfamily F protein uup